MELLIFIVLGLGIIDLGQEDSIIKRELHELTAKDYNEFSKQESKHTRHNDNSNSVGSVAHTDISLNNDSDECETEITEHFNSKASGKIVTCKGKLLKDGEKTRHIWRNK